LYCRPLGSAITPGLPALVSRKDLPKSFDARALCKNTSRSEAAIFMVAMVGDGSAVMQWRRRRRCEGETASTAAWRRRASAAIVSSPHLA